MNIQKKERIAETKITYLNVHSDEELKPRVLHGFCSIDELILNVLVFAESIGPLGIYYIFSSTDMFLIDTRVSDIMQ